MLYKEIEEYAQQKKGVEIDFKPEWEANRFLIGGKMFAMIGEHKDGRPIITVKLEPADGAMLRKQYENIIPGYYMNKVHWNSIYLDVDIPDTIIKKGLDESYRLVLKGLPSSIQKQIENK